MEAAQQIVVVYGMASLCAGFALGFPLSSIRMSAPHAPRHLVTAHLAAIIQGTMHLGLSVAFGTSDLRAWLEVVAAASLTAGSALFVAGAVANWLQRVDDHFALRSVGWKLLAASGPAHVVGIAIVTVGVVR